MAIDNRYDGEVINGATNFQKDGDNRVYMIKSYRQVKAHREAVYRDTEKSTEMSTEKSTKILLKPPIKWNYKVGRMVTEADFEPRLPSIAASPSECHLPMATDRNIPRSTARRLGRVPVHMNLLSITILEKLTY